MVSEDLEGITARSEERGSLNPSLPSTGKQAQERTPVRCPSLLLPQGIFSAALKGHGWVLSDSVICCQSSLGHEIYPPRLYVHPKFTVAGMHGAERRLTEAQGSLHPADSMHPATEAWTHLH